MYPLIFATHPRDQGLGVSLSLENTCNYVLCI
jgi:hypothetical protein